MSKSFPLAMTTVGEQVRLESIRGGKKFVRRLTALGLTPGVELSVVQDAGGPLLVSVRDSRIALGRGMAYRVMVSLVDSNRSKTNNEG
jgi:Fe2+ transport system protein FeoA